jgi:hypothetical protein
MYYYTGKTLKIFAIIKVITIKSPIYFVKNGTIKRNYAYYVKHILHKKKQLRAGELTTVFFFSTMNDKYTINYLIKLKNMR